MEGLQRITAAPTDGGAERAEVVDALGVSRRRLRTDRTTQGADENVGALRAAVVSYLAETERPADLRSLQASMTRCVMDASAFFR
ncbi:Uncharacterised protein [Rhodococcus gordoniae]|uniref:Uncharacterized protein n=1 Tax=Rhodococcus gordoniae TaxID=223392 RepID=A0A379LZ43_9NOCA|nr:Uncharacterised protein [Rhodococcus gordoniae]